MHSFVLLLLLLLQQFYIAPLHGSLLKSAPILAKIEAMRHQTHFIRAEPTFRFITWSIKKQIMNTESSPIKIAL